MYTNIYLHTLKTLFFLKNLQVLKNDAITKAYYKENTTYCYKKKIYKKFD